MIDLPYEVRIRLAFVRACAAFISQFSAVIPAWSISLAAVSLQTLGLAGGYGHVAGAFCVAIADDQVLPVLGLQGAAHQAGAWSVAATSAAIPSPV
jgi:hypothetical protein